jgi:hypothetical protein
MGKCDSGATSMKDSSGIFGIVWRLIRSRQLAHLFALPVYVARLPDSIL